MRRLLASLCASAVVLLAVGAATASAGTVSITSDGVVHWTPQNNEDGTAIFDQVSSTEMLVRADHLVPGRGCYSSGSDARYAKAVCQDNLACNEETGENCDGVTLTAFDATYASVGADVIDASNVSVPVTIKDIAGGQGQVFKGGRGNDRISAGPGTATVDGGPGNDLLMDVATADDGASADEYIGGEGIDRVDYTGATDSISVTLGTPTDEQGNPAPNDGPDGEDDVDATVEAVSGGAGDDTLTGDDSANVLAGYDGADTLEGGEGNDFLAGGLPDGQEGRYTADSDTMRGGGGSDTVTYSYLPPGGGVAITVRTDGRDGPDGPDGNGHGGFVDLNGGPVDNDTLGPDIERFNGSNNDDLIDANGAPYGVTLVGFGGSDELRGGNGADFLDAGQDGERNVVNCGGGFDTFRIQGTGEPSFVGDTCENGI